MSMYLDQLYVVLIVLFMYLRKLRKIISSENMSCSHSRLWHHKIPRAADIAPDVGVCSAGLQPPGPQPLPVADGGVPAGWGHQRCCDDLAQQTSLLGIPG